MELLTGWLMITINELRLVVQFWTLGMPAALLTPLVFLGCAALQYLLLWQDGIRKWLLPLLFAGILLAGNASIFLIRSYAALLIVIGMCFAMAALLGALVGTALFQIWTRVRS